MHKLCTVDVWDTLLRRNCHPEAVKLATAKHIFLRFRHNLADGYGDHWHIYEQRPLIERAMAEEAEAVGDDGEYELTAVLQRWLKTVLAHPHPEKLDEIAGDIAECELAFEIANTFPDEDAPNLIAAYPAERTLYLSDFYMPGPMLDRILAHHGLDRIVPNGIVSCDVMRNKRSGRLFQHVQALYNVAPQDHIHIGDNQYSDVERPRRLDVAAIHFEPDAGHRSRIARESLFASRDMLFDYLRARTHEAAQSHHDRPDPDAAAMFRLGLDAAPLFIGFALFVAERTIIDHPDRLFFLTREGEFFFRLFKTLFPAGRHAGHVLPPCAVLAASRQATFAASIEAVSTEEFRRIWNLNWQQRLSTLFGILGVEPQAFLPLLERVDLSPDELLVRPQEDPRIEKLIADPFFSGHVLARAREKRETLAAYLEQQGVRDGEKIGIVDIGWRGTIQDNLARIMPQCETAGYYLALRTFLNPQPSNVVKHAFGPDERFDDVSAFFETFEPLELLCNSPSGSVSGYQVAKDGTIAPERQTQEQENVVIERFVRHFQDGVLFAAEAWRPLIVNHAVMASETRSMALQIWKKLTASPPEELVDAYYAAPQHDVFGYGGYFDRNSAPSLATLSLAPFSRRRRHEVIQYVRRTQWAPAISGLKTDFLHKTALKSVFWLARRYKKVMILRERRRSL